ncbi:hypothetical protein GMMP15_1330014 [Candidatus Magnetomoraceae bacterium gMMP-15]
MVNDLKTQLAKKFGRSNSFDLWQDLRLSRHKKITPEIIEAVQNTKILLVILSPGYLTSDWCKDELETFLKGRSHAKIFIVERDKIEKEERPEDLCNFIGYRFWVQENETEPPKILGEPKPNPDDLRYYKQVDRLAYDLAEFLKKSKNLKKERVSVLPNDRPAVFLAEPTDDIYEQYEGIRQHLKQAEIKILPEKVLPFNDFETFESTIKQEFENSKFFVQLLSDVSGRKFFDGKTRSLLQFEQARKNNIDVLQWRSPEMNLKDAKRAIRKKLILF